MTRITFLQPHLRFDGTGLQTVLVANRFSSQGHETHLILHREGAGLTPELSDAVIVRVLRLESHLASVVVLLRKVLCQIDPYECSEDLNSTDRAAYIGFGKLKKRLAERILIHRVRLRAWANCADRLLAA